MSDECETETAGGACDEDGLVSHGRFLVPVMFLQRIVELKRSFG